MASPPYQSALSPPNFHASLPNPKKRPNLVMPHSQSSKRRKPSSFSGSTSSSHPLRQTSFPPEESVTQDDARSPSVDSDFTDLTGTQSVGVSTKGGKKEKRKRKRGAETIISGAAKAPADGRSSVGGVEGAEEEDEDAEAEGGGDDAGVVEEGGRVDRVAEKKKLAVLIDAFNEDQSERYNMYRRTKLKRETVRRITNQTLSQSVPPSVITTISGFTKVFIGTLIEQARDVQEEWAEAQRSLLSPDASSPRIKTEGDSFENSETIAFTPPKKNGKEDLGPLLPDHFREALRRYKRDGEGGGAGIEGTSLGLGVSGSCASKLGGKRLFR